MRTAWIVMGVLVGLAGLAICAGLVGSLLLSKPTGLGKPLALGQDATVGAIKIRLVSAKRDQLELTAFGLKADERLVLQFEIENTDKTKIYRHGSFAYMSTLAGRILVVDSLGNNLNISSAKGDWKFKRVPDSQVSIPPEGKAIDLSLVEIPLAKAEHVDVTAQVGEGLGAQRVTWRVPREGAWGER